MKEYQTITEISGPLVHVETDEPIGYDEIVEIETGDGQTRRGQVLDTASGHVAIQVLDRKSTRLNSSHIQKSRMPSSA